MRRRSSILIAFSFACMRFRIVCRKTVNRPFLVLPQMCTNPRKLKVSGFPSPRLCRCSAAKRPNSSSRVFSGCSSRSNFFIRSFSSFQNRSASTFS